MTAQELLSNYAKAENEFFTATETIRNNKLIKSCVFLNTTGKYNL